MDGEKTPGADARKVRRLLKPARLDRRLSLTPPISVDSLSSADTHKAIGLNAHCLSGPNHPMFDLICLTRDARSRTSSIISTSPILLAGSDLFNRQKEPPAVGRGTCMRGLGI